MVTLPVSALYDCRPSDVREAELAYFRQIKDLAEAAMAKKSVRVLLISGPSASGKTTTSHILCRMLNESGHPALALSLDDFYRDLDEKDYPRNDDGTLDYESPDSLDIPAIHDCLTALLQGGSYEMPRFDFVKRCRAKESRRISLPENGYLILEGLHAQNPRLRAGLPQEAFYKIFIHVATALTEEDGTPLLDGRDLRFLRRLSRDVLYRSATLSETCRLWEKVVAGEKKHLYPYLPEADKEIDTFHRYEIAVLAPYVTGILQKEPALSPSLAALPAFLSRFTPLPLSLVPTTSLLREFLPDRPTSVC